MSKKNLRLAAVGIVMLAGLIAGYVESAMAQGKMAEEVYKNIQALKGVPAEQVPITMQYFTMALGVTCGNCHVSGANEKDDKEDKVMARKMISMVLDINKGHFAGRGAISCYTCHRGNRAPVGTPVPSEAARPTTVTAVPEGVTADQLLAKFVASMGGDAAIAKITSKSAKGMREDAANSPAPIEMYSSYPDKGALVVHMVGADDITGYDGDAGWTANPSRGVRDMIAQDTQGTKLEDPIYLAANAKKLYTAWRVGRPEKIGDREAYVLNGTAPGRAPVRLYVDPQAGTLLRLIRYVETPVGRLPTQLDYSDYRDVTGVKVAHKIASIRPQARNTITLTDVQLNTPVDAAKFAKPANPPAR
ncbi:MAG: photosynthetic reaction center cytochrome c subunit [Acidobacteria bacterium]|nr:photosynthetic reaction center cytochrome c subunit [Acidobacteriota bacterium]